MRSRRQRGQGFDRREESASGGRMLGRRLGVGLLLALGSATGFAESKGPGRVSETATLTVLAGAVQRAPAGSTAPKPAASGASLAVGDRIQTAAGATALITFLDGSTVTVQPGSDVTVSRADIGTTSARINIRITLGTVWARVARLADPGSRLSLDSNVGSATVHDGLIGGQVTPEGAFAGWTQSPGMALTDQGGLNMMPVEPGNRVDVKPGEKPVVRPFQVNLSSLRVTVPPGVLPLLLMPDKVRVAGFVAPGVEVNQVLGSKTSQAADGSRGIEVPAGLPGPYLLVLEGQKDGSEFVSWAILVDGASVNQEVMGANLTRGGRIGYAITLKMDAATAKDSRTARATGGSAKWVPKLDGPLPGQILLAPAEVAAAAAR